MPQKPYNKLNVLEFIDKNKGTLSKQALDAIVNDIAEQQRPIAEFTAQQHAILFTELMKSEISKVGVEVMSSPEGWFELNSDTSFTVNSEGKPKTKQFSVIDDGFMGSFFEQVIMGMSANSESVPDLSIDFGAKLQEMTGLSEISKKLLELLSNTEIKVSAASQGSLTMGKKRFELPRKDFIKKRVDSKGHDIYRGAVDAYILEVTAVLKLLIKLISLFLTETERDTKRSKNGWVVFKYARAVLYAKLDITKVLDAFFKRNQYANGEGIYSILKAPTQKDLKKDPTKIGTDLFEIWKSQYEFGIRKSVIKSGNSNLSTRIYNDSFDLWTDDASRISFFKTMRIIEQKVNSGGVEKIISINDEMNELRKNYPSR